MTRSRGETVALKDTLGKVAGLFVEMPESEHDAGYNGGDEFDAKLAAIEQQTAQLRPGGGGRVRTVEQIVASSPGPNLDQVQVQDATPATTIRGDGSVDFAAIYQRASLPASSFTAEQLLDMINSLPNELPVETKRQTIKVTLNSVGKALGATPETIVADASRKMAALTDYTQKLATETGTFVSRTQIEIASLEAQIAEKKKQVEDVQQRQKTAAAQCHDEGDRLDHVLEFLSLDVPPSSMATGRPQ